MAAKPGILSEQADHIHTATAALLVCVLVLLLGTQTASAIDRDEPDPAHHTSHLLAYTHAIRLTAGENGPYLSLQDLQNRPRPTLQVLISRTIKPPPTMDYPAVLDTVPIAPRSYLTETVTYLAQHEIRYGDRQKPTLALTFDCEAGTNSTRKIVQTLREKEVKATFFVLGKYVYMFPDIVREIAADGHEFGNHSFFHPLYYDITPITATQEVTYTEAVLDWAVGNHIPMRYFRFPYGGRSDPLRRLVAGLGYQSAFWDLDPRGWEPHVTREGVVDYIRSTAHNGGIVIMHCGCWDDANALAEVIDVLREKGIEPGRLSDVLTAADRDVPGYAMPGLTTPP